ncbi:MAG: hypothetical protein JXR76_32500 [Deltaproteobacteria bacterium]|nr:hypothetical protein [Deltaproteobacteria bacterium]
MSERFRTGATVAGGNDISLYHWSRIDRRTSGTAGAQNSAGFGRRYKNRVSVGCAVGSHINLQMETCTCGGKMRLVAAITDGASIKKYLDGVGLPSEPPIPVPARPPPQEEFDYFCCDEGA